MRDTDSYVDIIFIPIPNRVATTKTRSGRKKCFEVSRSVNVGQGGSQSFLVVVVVVVAVENFVCCLHISI